MRASIPQAISHQSRRAFIQAAQNFTELEIRKLRVKPRDDFIKPATCQIDRNDVLLDRFRIEVPLVIGCNVTFKVGQSRIKRGYRYSHAAESLRAWQHWRGNAKDKAPDQFKAIGKVLKSSGCFQHFAKCFQPSVDAAECQNRSAGSNFGICPFCVFPRPELSTVLAKREQDCEKRDSRRQPAAQCGNRRPVQTTGGGERNARNHHFRSDHRAISIWVRRHCDTGVVHV